MSCCFCCSDLLSPLGVLNCLSKQLKCQIYWRRPSCHIKSFIFLTFPAFLPAQICHFVSAEGEQGVPIPPLRSSGSARGRRQHTKHQEHVGERQRVLLARERRRSVQGKRRGGDVEKGLPALQRQMIRWLLGIFSNRKQLWWRRAWPAASTIGWIKPRRAAKPLEDGHRWVANANAFPFTVQQRPFGLFWTVLNDSSVESSGNAPSAGLSDAPTWYFSTGFVKISCFWESVDTWSAFAAAIALLSDRSTASERLLALCPLFHVLNPFFQARQVERLPVWHHLVAVKQDNPKAVLL